MSKMKVKNSWFLRIRQSVTKSNLKLRSLMLAVIVASCATWMLAVRAHNKTALMVPGIANEPSPTMTANFQGKPPKGNVEAEVITILSSGFNPSEITRPKGLFLLSVENRSGARDIQLRLDREVGARIHDVRVKPHKDWREGLDLPPGRYILSEASHPEWKCIINIENR